MSGTSLDGIDLAYIETDGERVVKRGPSATYPYTTEQQAMLRQALLDALSIAERNQRSASLAKTEHALTQWHIKAVESFSKQHGLSDSNVDVIGFHGQTVLHKPKQRLTVQLGDGAALAKATKIPVVYDMRAADVAAGGQGAPLVPIYHAALANTRPSAFVNMGGVANVTFISNTGELLAFDTGPGNALINDWMMQHKATAFDEGGATALRGRISQSHLASAMAHDFFATKPPKSLDRNSFAGLDFSALSLEDGAATMAAFTAHSIAASAKWFSATPKQWVVCGGGRHNAAIMRDLAAVLPNVVKAETLGFSGDSMEAEAWAYLAVRSLKGLPLTFPGTTGVKADLTGGILATPK
ncbi:MAG: anhydro-N-acetylmuramic acid kinase [Pseudomonadota bacterium]|nr:anhydro-N-acetylmuramic acid kinase [Pseudomonadota bacterium]